MKEKESVRPSARHLLTPTAGRYFSAKLALCGAIAAGGILLTAHPYGRIPGTLLLGLMFAHAAELQHEALHGLAFRRSPLNTVAGIVLGAPLLIGYSAYREAHLRHHRYLGTPRNREFFDYGDQYGTAGGRSRAVVAWRWATRFLMLHHFAQAAKDMAGSVTGRDHPDESPRASRLIRRDYRILLFLVLAAVTVALLGHGGLVLHLWLLPLLVAAPVHALVELPEHYRCDTLDEDPFRNTRSIRSNRLAAWFTNGNNFHVEHHLAPGLAIRRLPDLHDEIKDRIEHLEPTYRAFFRTLLAGTPQTRGTREADQADQADRTDGTSPEDVPHAVR